MPIPPLKEADYLPEGIFDCTLEEIGERFARFQRSDCRMRLFERLKELVNVIQRTGMGVALIVDGSFATGKDEPNDLDLILVLKPDHDYQAELRPFEYNAVTKVGVKRLFHLDFYAFSEGSDELDIQIEFFQRVREVKDRRKGILRIRFR